MKSKIDEITDALKEITKGYGDDEKIFELGIELGKFLSTSGTEFTRLSYFLEQEQEREKESRIRETIKKISMLISRLFFVACVKKIEQTGKITFDANKHWSGSDALFNDEISDELFVQCVSVEQEDEDRDFQIEFEVLDKIAEIFDKYRAKKSIVVSAYNLSSSSSITFNNADNLSASLGNSRVVFYNNSSIDDEQKMIEMLDEINKATIFLQMKYSAL